MYIRKQDIYTLDIEHWADFGQDQFSEHVENSNLCNYSSWLLPQLVAHFGRWRLYSTGRETVAKNTHSNLDKVFYRLTRIRRSLLIKNQTQLPEYCTVQILKLSSKYFLTLNWGKIKNRRACAGRL